MRYKVNRHPLVRHDLIEITRLVGEYAGYEVSRRKMIEIRDTLRNLEDYPHIGSLRHDVRPNLRAISAAGKAVICFSVDDESRTVHRGQLWRSRLVRPRGRTGLAP